MSGFDAKCIFLLEIVKNLVNCSFQPTMEEKNSFHKEFFFMSGFDAKRIFQREMV